MELRVLQYFLAVAREQSISGAAASLHLSQPTLSTQLKNMEEELGKQLLIRGSKGSRKVTLTEEGMILRKRAEEILDLVKKTENEIQLSDDTAAGDVYIGAGETDIIRIVAKTAQSLQEHYPDIHYHIFSGNAAFVMDQLDKGLIDFGLVYSLADPAKYDSLQIPVKDTWGVLMRADSHLSDKDMISPEDLSGLPLILPNQKSDESPISRWFQQNINELNVVATYNLVFNASLLVDEGLGYALCFDKLINTADSNLCFRPLSPELKAEASIVWKRYQIFTKAADKFLKRLEELF
ncbi:LysR family transcriptional regulator [Anaerolentibacter hominis]|uniref:LysR family transcriptional regulator n=1 Tax=Anaerolentibacter hominis TaxID=3079009 RepID=UPI0031B86162